MLYAQYHTLYSYILYFYILCIYYREIIIARTKALFSHFCADIFDFFFCYVYVMCNSAIDRNRAIPAVDNIE